MCMSGANNAEDCHVMNIVVILIIITIIILILIMVNVMQCDEYNASGENEYN